MKNSTLVVKIDLGVVLDQTRMSVEDFNELIRCIDLSHCDFTPCYHILTDIDTDEVVEVQPLQSGLPEIDDFWE